MATNRLSMRFTITGDIRVAAYLRVLGPKLARGPARSAVVESVRGMVKDAKVIVPVEVGALKKALGYKVKAFKAGMGYYGIMGARKDPVPLPAGRKPRFTRYAVRRSSWTRKKMRIVPHKYLHLVEGGTRPHAVGRGSSLRRGIQIPPFHPGARKQPFMRAIANKHQPLAKALIATKLRDAIRMRGGLWGLTP